VRDRTIVALPRILNAAAAVDRVAVTSSLEKLRHCLLAAADFTAITSTDLFCVTSEDDNYPLFIISTSSGPISDRDQSAWSPFGPDLARLALIDMRPCQHDNG